MLGITSTARPSLIALQPTRLAPALRLLGAAPRELALQPPSAVPQPAGWGVLPLATPPLLIDLSGMSTALLAMLLDDLRRQQRRAHTVPLLITPPDAIGAQRLITNSALISVVISTEAPIETIARWALAPVQLSGSQVWVGLLPIKQPRLDARLIPLLAALSRARNVGEAARLCYLSQRTAYTLLTKTCQLLGTPHDQHHHHNTAYWVALVDQALATPPE